MRINRQRTNTENPVWLSLVCKTKNRPYCALDREGGIMFTKRHYRKIAEVLKDAKDSGEITFDISMSFAKMFAEDHPYFNSAKFMLACGWE